MTNPLLQLLVLGAIAVFLILRLRGVLGTRDGFEQPRVPDNTTQRSRADVIDGVAEPADNDIADHAEPGSSTGTVTRSRRSSVTVHNPIATPICRRTAISSHNRRFA